MKKQEEFIGELRKELEAKTLAKITLSSFIGSEEIKNIYIRPIEISQGPMCQFTYRYPTKDITKNYTYKTSLQLITDFLSEKCRNADAQFSESTISYKRLKSGKEKLSRKEREAKIHSSSHNIIKNTFIPEHLDFLLHLGLADKNGRIKDKARRKFRQINRFIEILDQQLSKIELSEPIKVVDMGCGKAYLTFAMYYYFTEYKKKDVRITGIENREELVSRCNEVSDSLNYSGLSFQNGNIIDSKIDNAQILVALHACDTATDDALAKGIKAETPLIITAPCCHKQVRKDMKKVSDNAVLLKYGIMTERLAEMMTDIIRTLILEDFSYKTQIIEFTNAENTAKNLMLIGIKSSDKELGKSEEVEKLKSKYGMSRHYLEELMYD